ncbi:MAG: hypothetical protein KDE35_13795 [Geminicoccaceae bacterium]|nr:hypothetical protein [Geminicoccaceae bacterium]
MSLPKITVSTVVKLLLASLVVGMALAWLDMDPMDLLSWVRDNLQDVFGNAADWVQWSVKYVLLGAVIVVPVWLVLYLLRAAKGSK